ncbi:MAG: hypothetical protein WC119_00625 [Synergistaceae bacterium]
MKDKTIITAFGLSIFFATIVSLAIIFAYNNIERGYYRYKNNKRYLEYYQQNYLMLITDSDCNIISFDGGSNWVTYIDGVAQETFVIADNQIAEIARPPTRLKDYNKFRTISGSTADTKYFMRSIDNGLHWAYYNPETGALIGNCPDVNDKGLREAWGFHVLTEYVKKNGPISLKNYEEMNILSNAGFSIERN